LSSPASGPPGTVVYAADFSRWARTDDASGSLFGSGGAYRVVVKKQGGFGALAPYFLDAAGRNVTTVLRDARIDANVQMLSGVPDRVSFGVLCRSTSLSKGYYFAISTDGFYAIENEPSGSYLANGHDAPVTQGMNHLEADCIGGHLAMFVNGRRLAQADDATYAEGAAGVLAVSQGGAAEADYSSFVVRQV
jgi:hypothetical protein